MKFNTRTLGFQGVAVALSLLLVPYGQPGLFAQDAPPSPQGDYAPLGVEQLNQLVAPIALYPDSLVAQILTAATYPQQVTDANNWMLQNGGMPPQQVAAAADPMPWDPSVKALTAFPSVLSNMARNYNWAAALGNAYYNQPGDVMNAVQAMRLRAQEAGALRTDMHHRVFYNDGLVVIEPVNPAFVYVPYYNPWTIYGGPIVPWGGYYWGGYPRGVALIGGFGFAAGISIGLYSHYGWGYHNWSPNWHGGVVVYNHNTYISRSTTVINRGNFGSNNRGVYEHGGNGVPHNYRPAVTSQSAAFRPGQGRPGDFRGSNYANRPQSPQQTPQTGRQFGQPRTNQPVTPQGAQNSQQTGRQFGQPRTNPATQPQGSYQRPQTTQPQGNYQRPAQPQGNYQRPTQPQGNQPQGNYQRPQTYRPPTNGGSPQVSRPSNNGGQTYHPPQGGGGNRPQVSTPRPQAAAPVHQQSAPSRSSGGAQSHSDRHR